MIRSLIKSAVSILFCLVSVNNAIGQAFDWLPPLSTPYIPVQRADLDGVRREAEAVWAARAEENRKEVAICAPRTKSVYESFKSYPTSFEDGWYNVSATNGTDMCGQRRVFVSGNKIARWFVNDIYEKTVEISSQIDKGSATVKVGGSFINCYFINNLLDPNSRSSAPEFGAVNFYTNDVKLRGSIDIYIEGIYMGEIKGFYSTGVPECGVQYTVAFIKKPGIYTFVGKNEKHNW